MNISLLRKVWAIIDKVNLGDMLSLNDKELLQKILEKVEEEKLFSDDEHLWLKPYLRSRILLIRDLGESRL